MNNRQQNKIAADQWRRHWERWKESGVSQAEYSRQHQVPIHVFRYWVTKFNQPAISPATTALVRLPIQARTASESWLELVVDKKYRLIIKPNFDSDLLHAVLSSLEGRSCS